MKINKIIQTENITEASLDPTYLNQIQLKIVIITHCKDKAHFTPLYFLSKHEIHL